MSSVRVLRNSFRSAAVDRFDTLSVLADELLRSGLLGLQESCEVFLCDEALLSTVEAYFLLSTAYKQLRTDPESPTQPPKIAALTALVMEEFKPLRLIDPSAPVQHPMTVQANRLFSLYWAFTRFDQNFADFLDAPRSDETLKRYFRALRATRLNSIFSYKTDAYNGVVKDYYDILLDHDDEDISVTVAGKPSPGSDMPVIDTMILVFELMWGGRG